MRCRTTFQLEKRKEVTVASLRPTGLLGVLVMICHDHCWSTGMVPFAFCSLNLLHPVSFFIFFAFWVGQLNFSQELAWITTRRCEFASTIQAWSQVNKLAAVGRWWVQISTSEPSMQALLSTWNSAMVRTFFWHLLTKYNVLNKIPKSWRCRSQWSYWIWP
jgi:hypothetical protein